MMLYKSGVTLKGDIFFVSTRQVFVVRNARKGENSSIFIMQIDQSKSFGVIDPFQKENNNVANSKTKLFSTLNQSIR